MRTFRVGLSNCRRLDCISIPRPEELSPSGERLTQWHPRLQLLPILRLRSSEDLHPFLRRCIESCDLIWISSNQSRSIIVVPSHLSQPSFSRSCLCGRKHRISKICHELDLFISARVPAYLDSTKGLISLGRLSAKSLSRLEAIDE